MMNSLSRMLTVTADGEPLSFSGRARLSGQDGLSLFPALFTLELWNLPEEYYLRLFRCKQIAVSHLDACLVSGAVSDVFRHPEKDGVVTTVAISLGLDLWEAVVSLAVPAGVSVSETVRRNVHNYYIIQLIKKQQAQEEISVLIFMQKYQSPHFEVRAFAYAAA